MTPPALPIFKETDVDLGELRFRFHEGTLASVHRFRHTELTTKRSAGEISGGSLLSPEV
jgi:hypothetical protein